MKVGRGGSSSSLLQTNKMRGKMKDRGGRNAKYKVFYNFRSGYECVAVEGKPLSYLGID